jgi:hypothetical protein
LGEQGAPPLNPLKQNKMAIQKLNATEVAEIQTDGKLFPYAKGTKMEGQNYRRYIYEGKVFISNDENFHNELEAGGIESLKIEPNDEGKLAMVGYVTFKKMIGVRRNQLTLEAMTVENFKPTAMVNVEDYAGLE